MIVQRLKDHDRDLLYSLYNTQTKRNSQEIDRFFKKDYKASDFLIYKESGVILCAMRVVNFDFYLRGYTLESNIIKDLIVSKNCPKLAFESFVSQALETFKYTKILTFVKDLDFDFSNFDYPDFNKQYRLYRKDLFNVDGYSIVEASSDHVVAMKECYKEFTKKFKSYALKDEESILYNIEKTAYDFRNVYVTFNETQEIMGYIVYEMRDNKMIVLEVIYKDAMALLTLLNQAMGMNESIFINVSIKENFSKILSNLEFETVNEIGIMINDEELFQRLYNVKGTSLSRLIKESNEPYYLGIY